MRTFQREKKVPVEQLQEKHLEGPAQESIEYVAKEMKENQVVVVQEVAPHQRIIFRNQRDPGHPLEFHYASKTVPFKMYKLIDGMEYDLPLEVIKNLEGCREHVHKYRRNEQTALPEIYIAGYRTHFVCERA